MTPQPPVPTLRQLVLATNLRQLRHRSKLTYDDVAARLGRGWSKAKLSRLENGHAVPSDDDLGRLLDLYGVDDRDRAELVSIRKAALQRGWWTNYTGMVEGPFVAMEDAAARMRMWEPLVVPGLLQTSEYARAVFDAYRAKDPHVEDKVRARLQRQTILTRQENAPNLDILIHEGALRLPVGGEDVMRSQVRALLDASKRSNITCRVVPFSAGAHAGLGGGFVIFDFETLDSIAFAGNSAVGNVYEEGLDRVSTTILTFERIADAALPVQESADFMSALT